MVGTIKVGKLQAADGTSDTISIESGHKLSGAAGSIAVPGSVIQIQKTVTGSGNSSTTSTSFVATGLSVDITPKFANSLIKIEFQTVWWLHLSPSAEEYFIATVYRTISGGAATNIGTGTGNRVLQWGSKYVDGGNAFNYNEGIQAFTFDTPSTTTSTNYKLYVHSGGGNEVRYIDQYSENSITATEIAQ